MTSVQTILALITDMASGNDGDIRFFAERLRHQIISRFPSSGVTSNGYFLVSGMALHELFKLPEQFGIVDAAAIEDELFRFDVYDAAAPDAGFARYAPIYQRDGDGTDPVSLLRIERRDVTVLPPAGLEPSADPICPNCGESASSRRTEC